MLTGVSLEGLDGKIQQVLQSRLNPIARTAYSLGVVPTSGRRPAEKNALIARVQAAFKRNPFYLTREDLQPIRFVARGLFSADVSVVKRSLKELGDSLLAAIDRHVRAQENKSGQTFKPLTPKYAAYKRRKFGFVEPILRATGDLLGGLRVRVDRQQS